MKKLKYLCLLCLLSLFTVGCSKNLQRTITQQVQIAAQAQLLNSACPIELDEWTTLLSVKAHGNTIVYDYNANITQELYDEIEDGLRQNAIATVSQNEEARADMIRLNANAQYNYYNGETFLGSFTVDSREW